MKQSETNISLKSLLVKKAGFFAFKKCSFKKHFLKPVSLVLVFTFSYTQILWAADVRQMLLNAKASFEDDTRRGGTMTATDLASAQSSQASAVAQQAALQDLQNMNFSLTTKNGDILKYVGDKLNEVQRPDGTTLKNIQVDASGNILNADLKLSDGSIQVFQNGQVLGYQTPDGSQVIYSNGQIQKVISKDGVETLYSYIKDANGSVTETVLDNSSYQTKYDANGKLKQVVKKGAGGSTTYYTSGMIQKIVNSDGSQVLFNMSTQANGDTIATPQGASTSSYIDANGNTFYFNQGNVSKIVMADNSIIDNINWDSANKIKDATLTITDGTKYIYQDKKLTFIIPVASNSPNVETLLPTATLGTSYRSIRPDGTSSWFESTSDNSLFTYWGGNWVDYTVEAAKSGDIRLNFDAVNVGSGGIPASYAYFQLELFVDGESKGVFNAPAHSTLWKAAQILLANVKQGQHIIRMKWLNDYAASGYDANFRFKNMKMTQISNPNPALTNFTYTPDKILAVTNGVTYEYLSDKTPTKITYADGSSTTFNTTGAYKGLRDKDVASNGTTLTQYEYQTGSGGVITVQKREVLNAITSSDYQPLSPVEKVDFRFNSNLSSNQISFTATQAKVGGITRTLTLSYASGKWTLTNAGSTTITTYVTQSLASATDYTAELRFEGTKANLYVYQKGQSRPTTPTGSLDAYAVATKLSASLVNATFSGQILKNLSTPSVSSVQSIPIFSRFDFLSASSLLKPASGGGVNNTDFLSITYDSQSRLKEIVKKDGTKFTFEAGLLKSVLDSSGNLTSLSFTESSLSNILGSQLAQNGLTSKYDATGKLSQVDVNNLSIYYKSGSNEINFITKTDGTQLSNLSFDASGNIIGATVITPDGEVRTYSNGKLVDLRKPDETELFYLNDKPTKIITPEKLTYNFNYNSPGVIEATLDASNVPDSLTAIKMQYDTSFNLKQVIRQNQEILNYSTNGSLASVGYTDTSKAPQVFHYKTDGKTVDYIEQGNIQTFYDANNQPTSSIISATADNPHRLDVSYQYGKIREIKKDGVLTFKYTYAFDSNSQELTNIEDLEEKTSKVYKRGNLLTSLNHDTSVLSTYTYESDKVKTVAVSRLGRTLHTYEYAYEGDNTLVTDEERVERTYDQNKKLLYLKKDDQKFGYSYTHNTDGEEIVEEKLIEKKLSDGSLVHYENGKASKIDLADGSFITDIVFNGDRQMTKGTINLPGGVKKVFDNQTILEEIDPDGTHFFFTNNKISKVVDSAGKELNYSYDKNQDGSIKNINVKKGDANLKYDSSGNLLGLKLPNILTPEEVGTQTVHAYEGGGVGAYSIDGNYDTAQSVSTQRNFDRNQGSVSVNLYSTHSFPGPQTITRIEYSAWGGGSGHGDYGGHGNGSYAIQYQLADGQWVVFPGASGSSSGGHVVKEVNLSGVIAVRAFANGYGEGSDHGSCDAYAYIYEIQYTLADQSFLSFNKATDAQGQVTGYSFSGYPGTMSFDSQENLLPGTPANLNSPAQSLNAAVASLTNVPHFDKINLSVPANLSGWFSIAKNSGLESQTIVSQEYSSSGILETQSKADGTVTLFDANSRPTEVLDNSGVILIQYSYDSDGHPTRVYLKNARDTLPDEVLKAKQSIEEGRASSLLTLAQQKNLAYQSIQSQVAAQKQALQSQLNSLQDQFNQVGNTPASGKKAKSARGDVLNQIGSAMDQVRGALANLSSQEADAYAALDSQVKAVSDQIEADSQAAFTALTVQEANLKKEILRQEVSPVVYDYYRRILGRDPSSLEYDYWISKMAYDSGNSIAETKVKDASATVQNTLPVSTLSTNARSTRSDGSSAWFEWTSQGALFSYWGNTWLDYALNAGNTGDLSVSLEGINVGSEGIPASYTNFNVDFYIDGVKKGTLLVPASMTVWQKASFTVPGLAKGAHTLRLVWTNDNAASGDANFMFRNLSLTQTVVQDGTKLLSQALKDYLNALPELQERTVYVNTVKQNVTSQINSFLAMSDSQKQSFASGLGLSASDLINLSSSDAQKILTWLNGRSLHFGQSAFLALESLLDQKAISYTRTDIAQKAILIDVLTGVISPLDDGDLVISVFALNKVAQGYGLTLNGANLTWEDLLAVYQANPTARIIAHINGNHFVIVTNITADSITYIDPGIGKDKQNESLTVTKEGFLKAWKGNVTLEQNKLQTVTNYQNKALSALQTQNIRGAFWGSWLGILGFVISIFIPGVGTLLAAALSFISNALQIASLVASIIEKDWLSAATAVVTLGFSDIGKGLANFFNGAGPVGQAINGVGQFFGTIFQSVQGFFSTIGNSFSGFLHSTLNLSGAALKVAETAVSVGVNYGVSRGLETLGINPQIASFLGSLTAGGIIGGMKGNTQDFVNGHVVLTSIQQNIQASIQQVVTLNQVGRLGLQLGIDPYLTNIVGLSLAAIQGIQIQNPGGYQFGIAFSQIKPQLLSSLAQYGVDKLGTSLGLDPRVSGLIGTPVSSALGVGLQGGVSAGSNIINAVKEGITRGITNFAVNYTGDALHLSPFLTSISATALGGAISGLFGIQQVDPNDPNHVVHPANMFEGISNAFLRGLSSTLTLGGAGNDSWSQAAQLQRITGFSTIAQQMGLSKAIDTYATSMFQQTAIEQMVQISGSVQKYIDTQLSSGNYVQKTEDGHDYKYIMVPGSKNSDPYSNNLDSAYVKVDTTAGHEGVYGFADQGYAVDGQSDLMSDNGLGLNSGIAEVLYQGSKYIQKWYGGQVVFTNVITPDGYTGTFYDNSPNLIIANKGQFFDGRFIDESGSTIIVQDSKILGYQQSITDQGLLDFTADLVTGLNIAYSTVQSLQSSAGKGALKTLVSDDYKHVSGVSAASLANYVGDGAKQYLKTHYNVQDTDFATYAHLFGDVGDKISALYSGYLKAENFLVSTVVDGALDVGYLGTEIPLMWDEVGKAYQSLKIGDLNQASEYMGSVGTRLFREGNRALFILTLGLSSIGEAGAEDLAGSIGKDIVGPLGETAALRFGTNDLVYGPSANNQLFLFQQRTGGKLLTDFPEGPGSMGWFNYSVSKLEQAVSGGNYIRFDLTYMGDQTAINQALNGTGEFGGTVTSQELRYISDNWGRLKSSIKFYRNGKEVVAPW